uniref:Uncharacterized protein n=1 Tax=Trypanosoma vivax (strain Y486) TaxID=1055687 RepID=G0U6K1_TRYVY|nr:hypothetical protein TVY486_1005560 [Trypanosoma vivax Y486]
MERGCRLVCRRCAILCEWEKGTFVSEIKLLDCSLALRFCSFGLCIFLRVFTRRSSDGYLRYHTVLLAWDEPRLISCSILVELLLGEYVTLIVSAHIITCFHFTSVNHVIF